MESGIELTSEEKNELEKRGFLVKNLLTNKQYFVALFSHNLINILFMMLFGFSIFILGIAIIEQFSLQLSSNTLFNFALGLLAIGPIISLWISIYISYIYSLNKDALITKSGNFFVNNALYRDENDIPLRLLSNTLRRNSIGENYIDSLLSINFNQPEIKDGPGKPILIIFIKVFDLCLFVLLLIISIIPFLCGFLLRLVLGFTLPISKFINLGEKIQSLTPQISEQSKQIESEFRGDMDFRVLSKSFDSLASTFSDIVNLVIKLEKVEKRANQGDLFDSTKYINSLRDDIRTPLLSLKTFLETQKVELQSSQQELMKVRVSVGGEGENRELQSIRATELMKELDENIVKIGVMIGNL